MKYRELTPNEIEAYNIGYKVGNRKIVITDIEWESENEHKIYRKGYMAGLMDYKRNVSNVSNVEIETSTTSITPTTPIGISIRNGIENKEIGGMGEKEKEPVSKIDFDTQFQAGGQLWTLPSNFRKLALTKYTESEIRAFETTHSCHEHIELVCLNDIKHQETKSSRAKKASVSLGDITIPPEHEYLRPVLENWLGYKKDIKDEYKSSRGLLACIKQLHDYSGGNLQKANKIVERSMANNWKGIFPLQPEKKGETKNLSNYVGESSFLKPTNDDPFLSDL